MSKPIAGTGDKYGTDYCYHGWPIGQCAEPQCRPVANSWTPVDLGPYLNGEVKRAQPTVGLYRTDGVRLFYPGKEHAVIGEMETGKDWVLVASAAAEMDAGNHVVFVHYEEGEPSDPVERLLALGVRPAQLLKLFHFIGPDRKATPSDLALLLDPTPSLVIHNGVNEAMSLHGWDIRAEDGAAAYRRYLVKPCTAVGAAVVSADHVVKDPDRRGRYALGSIHKGNALSGATILLENAEPFGRRRRGRSHVFVTKDRPGHLRQHGQRSNTPGKTFMGELTVDDEQRLTPDLELKFWAPTDKPAPSAADPDDDIDAAVLATVQQIMQAGKVANLRTVHAAAKLRKDTVDDALARLVFADQLEETRGTRGARIFTTPTVPQDPSPGGVP